MGIPGLARRLEPYASHYSSEQLDGYTAIVDGPSLAYYAHKLALSTAGSQFKIPSYADINTEAIRWLDSLEKSNIKVSNIVFDGALPQAKRAERVSRTEQNNRRIHQFRASYPNATCPVPTYLGAISYAFLAPSLMEALCNQSSAYASRTRIVPGEADDSCALHAKELARSLIFTSDSDLALYEYPQETLIVFFHDAVSSTGGTKAYSPHQVRQKLQLTSLLPFALAILRDPSVTSDIIVNNARKIKLESSEYLSFSARYNEEISTPSYLSKNNGRSLPMQDLDVRVSEFVHQALSQPSQHPLVYLPLLLEDPNQASAWNMGQDIRTLAYSLLHSSTVHEYKRKAQVIAVQEISPYSHANLQVPATDIERQISVLMTWASSKSVGPELVWPLFALSIVLGDLNTPPPIPLVLRVLNGDFDNNWAFIQFSARIQAVLYSLRMLKQVVAVWLAINETAKIHEVVKSLHNHMTSFPSIPDMFTVSGQGKKVLAEHEELKTLVEEIYTSAGAEVPTEQVSNKKKKRQAREAERKKRKVEQRQQQSRS
ncbi:hypothetical protein P153DRAFT_149589 [Dothidotthia symphoricarpi CBS 119687]|uniref:Asteroid domain-containing protein n=1 Tax=Dothidotthia symphoricarpi CBS 119687 TaxID=1392245 RepID=A0A6A6AQH6_9PLEO|nr:uncharacterized protein P153DRAFT_149589 [Dothidotthia symphoricarpi CBS 119687]KAF2133107.1 hypothetical protein P153DRAFT_149589 [Dothidotthia symphoricarpi CBS 119687]